MNFISFPVRSLLGVIALEVAIPAQAAELGTTIDRALAVHLSPGGLEQIGNAVEAIVPNHLDIDEVLSAFTCVEEEGPTLAYQLENTTLTLSTDNVDIDTSQGTLDITLYATLSSEPSVLYVLGDCGAFENLWEVCDINIPTTAIEIRLSLAVTPDDTNFDVTVQEFTVDISPISNPVQSCIISNAVNAWIGQNPYALSNMILDLVSPEIDELTSVIETTIEEQFQNLAIETTLPLGSAELALALRPSEVRMDDKGLLLGLSAMVDTTANPCVDSSAGSTLSNSDWPEVGDTAPGTALPYDIGMFISKDFADQLLYGIWASGLLCVDVDNVNGTPLTTSLIGALVGPEFSTVFPEEVPAIIHVRPNIPMTASFSNEQPVVEVNIHELGLEFETELDSHRIRAFRIDADAKLGMDLSLIDSSFSGDIVFDPDAIGFYESYVEIVSPGFADNFGNLAGPLVGEFLPDDLIPSFVIPNLLGVQIEQLVWNPTPDGEWQGGFVIADISEVQRVELPGCQLSASGCQDADAADLDLATLFGCEAAPSGCEGSGCWTLAGTAPLGRFLPMLLVIVGALVRRQR